MWDMSFVFKNVEWIHWITTQISRLLKIKSLTTIFKVAGYFSAECVRSLEEHTKKNWK